MIRKAIAVILILSAVSSTQVAARHRAMHHRFSATINSYRGVVDQKSFDRFDDLMWHNLDKVIELKVQIEHIKDGTGFTADVSDGRLIISAPDKDGRDMEVVVNGPVGSTMDMLALDGFYLVKNGGMHAAGALSVGLNPVPEASIRLAPHIRIINHEF